MRALHKDFGRKVLVEHCIGNNRESGEQRVEHLENIDIVKISTRETKIVSKENNKKMRLFLNNFSILPWTESEIQQWCEIHRILVEIKQYYCGISSVAFSTMEQQQSFQDLEFSDRIVTRSSCLHTF